MDNNYYSYGNNNQTPNGNVYGDGNQNGNNKKPKKKGGFGAKLAKCAALALVFGLVSGVVFEGVQRTSDAIFGTTTQTESQASSTTTTTKSSDSTTSTASTKVLSTITSDVSDVVSEAMPSIVAITNVSETEYNSFWGGSQTYESTSCGSGIIISKDDSTLYIATNNHVVSDATSLTVTFCDDSTVSATVKGTSSSVDLAVVAVDLSSIEADTLNAISVATIGDSDALSVGESAIAIGNALGYGQSVTTGVISALNREVSVTDSESGVSYTAELIQTDAAINPGNSGGALLNAAGEVIGINSVKYSDTSVEGIGYAIPMNTAWPILQDLITKEKVSDDQSAYLGIQGLDVSEDVAQSYNMPVGVYVNNVIDGSAAANAGIQKGDIITGFDGYTITSMQELSEELSYHAAGETVDMVVKRASNGEYVEQTISVTLGAKN